MVASFSVTFQSFPLGLLGEVLLPGSTREPGKSTKLFFCYVEGRIVKSAMWRLS